MDAEDSAVGEFSAVCIREFLQWSLKHSQPEDAARRAHDSKPALSQNAIAVMRKLYSFALHPGVFYRIGSATAFCALYKVFR